MENDDPENLAISPWDYDGPESEKQQPELPWWQRMMLIGGPDDDIDDLVNDPVRFKEWKLRRDASEELRAGVEAEDERAWEDWLDEGANIDMPWSRRNSSRGSSSRNGPARDDRGGTRWQIPEGGGWYKPQPEWEQGGMPRKAPTKPERGMSRTFKELIFKILEREEEVEDELVFEERVFRYTSQTTAKFVAVLVIVPWLTGWAVHDFVLLPFLRRYVETTPLIAEMLDVREKQKAEMIEELKLERQRVKFEAEIGKAPPLNDQALAEHLHDEARHLREEVREENRSAFAYIFSDILSLFIFLSILYFNPKLVAIMRMTGERIFTNVSDTGKAFIIILGSDIFLGYHSESGWETVVDLLLEHYGLPVNEVAVVLFVSTVPVTIDACFKLWVFERFTRLSPSAAATFREMKRH